ncbi:hypothetical protein Tsubulata_003915, partial [Turnera subulata]
MLVTSMASWRHIICKQIPHRELPHRNYYACGFGYDSASNDYKVFAATSHLLHPRLGVCKAEIFSLKTGSWKKIKK